ncbi:MAG TPA: ABC transporter permease, partial [Actinomycetota bacterium]|nr:ABC transporter permease [Actinomycetota bacterium]
ANTFVPSQTLPSVLRIAAEWNPVSAAVQAARNGFGNNVAATAVSDAWSLNHPVLYTVICVGVILAIFVPLSVRQYERAALR